MSVRNIQSINKFRKHFTATLLQTLIHFMAFYFITMFPSKEGLQEGVLNKTLSLAQGGISNYQVRDLQHILLVVRIVCVSYRS